MSLAIQQESDVLKLSELLEACEYDFKITINTEIDFLTSASGCAHPDGSDNNVALDSATAMLLHELLHGLGIYSLVAGNAGGGLDGGISLYDTLLRHTMNNVMAFPTAYHVETFSGQDLTHYDLSVAGHAIFNPTNFVAGSSLSHLIGNGVIGIDADLECVREIDTASIDVLNALGWQCAYAEKVSGGICTVSSDCLSVLDQMCMHCDDAHRIDRYIATALVSTLCLCAVLLILIVYHTHVHAINETDAQHSHADLGTTFKLIHRLPPINNF